MRSNEDSSHKTNVFDGISVSNFLSVVLFERMKAVGSREASAVTIAHDIDSLRAVFRGHFEGATASIEDMEYRQSLADDAAARQPFVPPTKHPH
jgi:hypothetical protein